MNTSLDTCMSDSDLDTRFPSLAYHKYCAKDMANHHRNIGSTALVRATFTTIRSLSPYTNTTQPMHIHELSTVASPMCSLARLVALPIAYPQALFLANLRFCVHYCIDRDTAKKIKTALRAVFLS